MPTHPFFEKVVKNKISDNTVYVIHRCGTLFHITCPLTRKAKAKARNYTSKIAVRGVFLRSILKRKSEVLTQQQKVFKNRLFEMCQYVVPVVRSSEKGRPLLRPRCQKARLFHYTQPKTIHASH